MRRSFSRSDATLVRSRVLEIDPSLPSSSTRAFVSSSLADLSSLMRCFSSAMALSSQ
jgi:hypothetical protein